MRFGDLARLTQAVARRVGRYLAVALPLTGGSGLGCGDDALERVRVCGDLVAPDELTAVRVALVRVDGGREMAAGVVDMVATNGEASRQLPISVSLSAASGTHIVRAQGIGVSGAEVIRSDVLVADGDEGAGGVIVNLVGDCIGMTCALGQTCVAGKCEVIPEAGAARCDAPAGGDAR